jgi:hypothetical protein
MSVHTKLEAERRTDNRKRVLMVATMITCDGPKRVRIRDFSSKGAQIVLEGEITKCDVLLKRGDLCAAARVAWIKGDEIGLTFYREISAAELAAS